MAIESQGVKLFISTNATVRTTNTQIMEIVDFTGPGGAAAVIDITSLDSTAKEKLIGLRDEGQLSFSMNFNATDAGQVALKTDRAARTKRAFQIDFSDAATNVADFKGYVLQYSIAGSVDNKISANAVVEITGAVTYTTA